MWHFCKASDARKVERVQERANLPSLQNRRKRDLATLMYKVDYGLVPSNVADIFSVKSYIWSRLDSMQNQG